MLSYGTCRAPAAKWRLDGHAGRTEGGSSPGCGCGTVTPRLAPLRVLVVEDDDLQRTIITRFLRKSLASEVFEANDGQGALDQLTEGGAVDVIVSDLDMPGMDGIEFLRHVGARKEAVAVVLVSGAHDNVLTSVRAMAAAYGVQVLGVVPKPLDGARLVELVASQPAAQRARTAAAPMPAEQVSAGLQLGEFEPFFQPQVDMATLRVHGFEALARWRTAQGVLGPGSFMPVVEAHALIDELTWAMLRGGCQLVRKAVGLLPDVLVSVNVSIQTLEDAQAAHRILAIVAEEGVDPRRLVLEVTESAAADGSLGPVLENLTRLRIRGFGLSIDDFGTGYSSLQQLARIPFTELKIDQSFVSNAHGSESGLIMLQSTLEMAHRMKLLTVAEGVETRAHWDLLQELGCCCAQGYLLARPMAMDLALDWAATWQRGPAVPA